MAPALGAMSFEAPGVRPDRHGRVMIANTVLFTGNANPALAQEIAQQLGIELGRAEVGRFSDGEVTVDFVECLASCGTAPVVLIDDDLHEKVDCAKAKQLSAQIKAEAKKR